MALLPFVSSDPGPLSIVHLGSCGGLVAKLCLTLVTLWTVAHQAPLSIEIFQARMLEWIAISFSRGSSWHRGRTQVSCTIGIFFTNWATREAKWALIKSHQPAQSRYDQPLLFSTTFFIGHSHLGPYTTYPNHPENSQRTVPTLQSPLRLFKLCNPKPDYHASLIPSYGSHSIGSSYS